MGMNSERRMCEGDQDCLDEQYCYDISKRCVNYTLCSNYNRVEAAVRARHPYECGPCLKGYTTDIFVTNEAPLCLKKDNNQTMIGADKTIIIVIVSVVLILMCLIVIIYMKYDKIKNYISERSSWFLVQSVEINQNNANIANIPEEIVASAPPEQRPFIEKANCIISLKTNEMIDNDQFQTARPIVPPNWVQNANYGTNMLTYSSDEMDMPEENHRNSTIQLVSSNDDNVEERLSGLSEFNMQHDNNNRSIPLTNNSANEDSINNADNANINTSCFESTPNEETNRRDKIKHIVINQLVNQNITMNVNVNNEE